MSGIEKESLEAHVDMCGERYNNLQKEVSGMGKRMDKMESMLTEMRDIIQKFQTDRNRQLMSWGVGIIGALVAACGSLLFLLLSS